MDIPFARGDRRRGVAKSADILTRNRFFENNPVLTETGVSLLARPGLKKFIDSGLGPVRAVYSQAGSFDGDLFVVSGRHLYRVSEVGTYTLISGFVSGDEEVRMVSTARIGTTPEYLFYISSGGLHVYDGSSVNAVPLPDGVLVADLCYIGSHVIVTVSAGQSLNGRFYWIAPGEVTVDPIDFATAEREPDAITQAVSFGDNFWLFGTKSAEVWYLTGDEAAPVLRLQGVAFNFGAVANLVRVTREFIIVTSPNGTVFRVDGGGAQRISSPDVEERVRKAFRESSSLYVLENYVLTDYVEET